jgi:hypothetical protein
MLKYFLMMTFLALENFTNIIICGIVQIHFQMVLVMNYKGGINIQTDHAITTGYDPAYIYTGIKVPNKICTSIDFN